MTPKVKVCGITDAGFARGAAERGVDYLGFVFAEGSPRRVTAARARDIADSLGRLRRGVRLVGVFVDMDVGEITSVASEVGLDVVQLHGTYEDDDVSAVKARGFEVWRLRGRSEAHTDAGPEDAVLLDGRVGQESRPADWTLVAALRQAGRRVVLAGGLSAGNIAAAAATGADVLDVNSSLETSPGVKSLDLLDALLPVILRCRRV